MECLTVFTDLWNERAKWDPTEHYDLIHAHFLMPTGVLAAAVKRFTGLPE